MMGTSDSPPLASARSRGKHHCAPCRQRGQEWQCVPCPSKSSTDRRCRQGEDRCRLQRRHHRLHVGRKRPCQWALAWAPSLLSRIRRCDRLHPAHAHFRFHRAVHSDPVHAPQLIGNCSGQHQARYVCMRARARLGRLRSVRASPDARTFHVSSFCRRSCARKT